MVAAAMNELSIEEISMLPDSEKLPDHVNDASRQQKFHYLNSLSSLVVDKYILKKEKVTEVLEKMKKADDTENDKSGDSEKYCCRFPVCQKVFKYDGKRRRAHEKTHDGMIWSKTQEIQARKQMMMSTIISPLFFK